jgi:hypothetical protein
VSGGFSVDKSLIFNDIVDSTFLAWLAWPQAAAAAPEFPPRFSTELSTGPDGA